MRKVLLSVLSICSVVFAATYTDLGAGDNASPIAGSWATLNYAYINRENNKFVANTNSNCTSYWSANTIGANQFFRIKLGAHVNDGVGFFLRGQIGAYSYYLIKTDYNRLYIYLSVASTLTPLGVHIFASAWAPTDSITGYISTDTIVTWKNVDKTDSVQAIDATYATGVCGLYDSQVTDTITYAYFGDWPISSCTQATVKPHGLILDTLGNPVFKFADTITNAFDSVKWNFAGIDSLAALSVPNDSFVGKAKKKCAKTLIYDSVYSCGATKNIAIGIDTVQFVGPSASYAAKVCTLFVPWTLSVASSDMADSFSLKSGAPAWVSIHKTGGSIGQLYGTPTDTMSATNVWVYAWRKGVKADSGAASLSSVVGVIVLDSIRPVNVYAGQIPRVYGRGFWRTGLAITIHTARGDSTATIVSQSDTSADFRIPWFAVADSVDTVDFIMSEATTPSADTLGGGFIYMGMRQFTVSVTASGPGTVAAVANPQDSGVLFAIAADSGNGTSAPWDSFAHWTAGGGAVITSTTTRHTTMYLSSNGTAQALFGTRAAVVPVLYLPNQNDTNQATTLAFKWHPQAADSGYYLWYDTTLSFNSPLLVKDTLTDTSKTVVLGLTNSWYHWKVAGFNGGGTSAYSSPRTFKTMPAARRRRGGMNIGIGIGIGF